MEIVWAIVNALMIVTLVVIILSHPLPSGMVSMYAPAVFTMPPPGSV